ncbi:hypothetical protein [Parvibaculum sp. MBR-TMA-1.3b-4.2]|jgi:hypothetical protein
MALDRKIPNSTTPGTIEGDVFMDETQEELTGLWDRSVITLSNVAGTANDVTADIVPALTDGLKDGMNFIITAAADNDDAMTLKIGGEAEVDWLDSGGNGLVGGEVKSGSMYMLTYIAASSAVRMLGQQQVANFQADYQAFTSSGTWTKPAGLSENALVQVEIWGGGGGGAGGGSGGGGGGGGYNRAVFRASAIADSVSVTIGAGGATGTAGGTTSFGAYLNAYGGGGGENSTSGGGGGGGGQMSAGTNGTSGEGGVGGGPLLALGGAAGVSINDGGRGEGAFSGGGGGGGAASATAGAGGGGVHGGGGGGGSANTGTDAAGGQSLYGGGGGGGSAAAGGTSQHGGNGGTASAGIAPAGGGAASYVGARGECHVHVIG